ncbi:hypothetical protein [Paenimyroides viscosum]|uniref:Uncharacterized protein n=1 Tax=Paenimyroides viscosum TaxID=2488729 RepID=A0A3P1B899_9FLAO|nr:hypothetical protein [Paenimyroides viscosum]RRA96972.1 hypothetical protein EG242_00150 [Paenimyroides viscosum]
MMKILVLGCLLLTINSYSQTSEEIKFLEQAEAAMNDDVYTDFLDEVIKFRLSEDSLYEIYYTNSFTEKINSVENSRETCSLSDFEFEKWAEQNLNKTKFSSVKEAVDLFINLKKYTRLNESKNNEINLKLQDYKEKYGLLLHNEFTNGLARAEMNAYNKLFQSTNNLTSI